MTPDLAVALCAGGAFVLGAALFAFGLVGIFNSRQEDQEGHRDE